VGIKDRNSRAKLAAGWTAANERTVKHWILGRYTVCGRHLVILAQHSDQVLNAVLTMADRQDLLLARI
jgi:BioD-like phosphotransacetylase family protein